MTPEVALAIVEARLLGPQSIPVRIRTREEVTEDEIAELLAAVDYLIVHYRDQAAVPKTLAAAFVDIYNGFVPAGGRMSDEPGAAPGGCGDCLAGQGVSVVWCLILLLLPVPLECAACLDGDRAQSLADG